MLNLVISTIGEAVSVLSVSTYNMFKTFVIVLHLNYPGESCGWRFIHWHFVCGIQTRYPVK